MPFLHHASCVWCYQEFADKLSDDLYKHYLSAFDYGNRQTGKTLNTFWLDGDLAISAHQQITFLRQLYLQDLPIKPEHMQVLKKIMIVDESEDYSLRAKTGWANRLDVQHGWYVGYIEVKGKVWLFANNIQIASKADLVLRKQLVIEALKLKKII